MDSQGKNRKPHPFKGAERYASLSSSYLDETYVEEESSLLSSKRIAAIKEESEDEEISAANSEDDDDLIFDMEDIRGESPISVAKEDKEQSSSKELSEPQTSVKKSISSSEDASKGAQNFNQPQKLENTSTKDMGKH